MRLVFAVAALLLFSAGSSHAGTTLDVGDFAPDILGYDTAKDPIMRDDFEGSVVIINFSATWCGPCLKELPVLDKMTQLTSDADLKVLALN